MSEISIKLIIETKDAETKLRSAENLVSEVKQEVEKPAVVKLSTEQALASIRDVTIAMQGVAQIISSVTTSVNTLLNASLEARQSAILSKTAFGEYSNQMAEFAQNMQSLTNFEGDQLLALMSKLSQTFKLNTSEIKDLVPAILDFAEANKATGMTVESAFDLMGRAINGHTEMLGRYCIELDDVRLKEEGVSYLVEKLTSDYGGTAKALADLRIQNKNTWGDVQESLGDMLNVLITPLLSGLKSLFEGYQKLSPIMKGFVTALVLAVPVIGTVTTSITVLTTAFIALKTAINPVAGIVSLIVTALVSAGFGYASYKLSVESAKDSQKSYNKEVENTDDKLKKLIKTSREYAQSLDYSNAKKELSEVSVEIDKLLAKHNIKRDQKMFVLFDKEDFAKLQELFVKEGTLREKVRTDDLKTTKQWSVDKLAIDKENSLSETELLAYQLSEARAKYKALGKLDTDNYQNKKDLYAKIKELEGKVKNQLERDTEQRLQLQQKYTVLAISEESERQLKQLEIERDAELKRAKALKASEETLLNIKSYYENETVKIKEKAIKQRETEALAEAEKQKQLEQEKQNTFEEFERLRERYLERTMDSELNAIDLFYQKKKDKLLSAGVSEQQITEQIEMAKHHIRETYNQRAMQGFSTLFGNLAQASQAFGEKGFKIWKAMAMTQALVDTYSSANAAYKAMAGIPVIGPALAVVASVAAITAGLANVAMISKQKPPKAEFGGLLAGKSHLEGGILIEAEGEEYITRKSRVKELGSRFFDFINYAPLETVKTLLIGLTMPTVPMPSLSGMSYGSGGMISNGMVFKNLLTELTDLKQEVINLQTEVKNKNLTVVNMISANEVIKKADSTLVSQKAEQGTIIRSSI